MVQGRNDCEKCGFHSIPRYVYVVYIADLGSPADFFIVPAGPVLGGADTVSKRDENIILRALIASLDFINRANAIPGRSEERL